MKDKASDKNPASADLDDKALDAVVGGCDIGPLGGPSMADLKKMGGGGAGSGTGGATGSPDGGGITTKPSGPFEPNSIHFPK